MKAFKKKISRYITNNDLTIIKNNIKIVTLIFAILFLSTCKKEKEDQVLTDMKGNVKTITEYRYKGIYKNGKIEKGDFRDKTITKYNVEGKITEENIYFTDGSLESMIVYKYIDKNNFESFQYESNGTLIYKYTGKMDNNGNVIELKCYTLDGQLEFILEYKYDANRMIEEVFSDMHKSNPNQEKTTYTYNDLKNSVILQSYSYDGLPSEKLIYSYTTFDSNKNWTTREEISSSNYYGLTERIIEYYK